MLRFYHWRFPPSLAAARMLSSPPPPTPHSQPSISSGVSNSISTTKNSKPKLLSTQSQLQNLSSSSLKSTVACSSSGPIRQNMTTVSQCFSTKQEPVESDKSSLLVVSFYKFADFPDHADLRKPLKDLCEELVYTSKIETLFYI